MESSDNGVLQGAETVDQSCTEIIIVRHGETEWNVLGKMQGQADIDLNETGKQHAKAVAERLSTEPGIIAVYSSDLKRALETAEIIAARCNGLEVITDQDLRERHIGELQGLVYHDLPKLNPKAYDALRCHGLDQEIPGGGETHRELYRRCTSSLQRIGEKHRGQRVVVVTHGAVIETLYKRVVPEGKYDGVGNASVGIIQLSEGDIWLIKLWNDVLMESNYKDVLQEAETVDQSCTEIILVRHGETEWNVLRKMQGQADIELNETGKQQARTVAERLSREAGIVAVYSSDLKRALVTAEIISARFHGLEVIKDQDLRERHIGGLQGLVYRDLPKLNPRGYDALRSQELDQELPGGGETRRELYRRCTSSLQRIGENHRGQRVIVVTHGAVIETLYKRAVPEGKDEGIANASIGIIQLSEGDIWLIKLWNDVSHLSDNSSS